MKDEMQRGMMEATRLTREGKLAEATALIQRALAGNVAPAAHSGPEVIEVPSSVIGEKTRPEAPSEPSGTAEHNFRRPPAPPRGYRSAPRESKSAPASGGRSADFTAGRFVERSYTNRAGTRGYKLYVPGSYVGQEVALVVMLHGCTQNPDDFAAGTKMNALSETFDGERTFLVAYPAQSQNANISKCWNWFKASDQERGQGEPSIIAGITCEVLGEYNVDPGRVYVAGMSAGGAMAAVVGDLYPDLYAAVGVHSGLAPGAARDFSGAFLAMQNGSPGTSRKVFAEGNVRRAPVITFHGDRDTTVSPKNAEHLLRHFRPEGSASPVRVRQGKTPGGYSYTRAAHHDAEGRATLEQWTVHGLGHAWSGGDRAGSYTDTKGPDASAEMVRFFEQNRR